MNQVLQWPCQKAEHGVDHPFFSPLLEWEKQTNNLLKKCYGLIVFPPNLYVKALTSTVTPSEDSVFREIIKVK